MSNINTFCFSGNLTRDAELKSTNSGTSVLSLSIAVNERRKSGDDWEDHPNFFDLVMFGRRAESIAEWLTRGTKVMCSGRIRQERWKNENDENRSKVSFIVDEIEWVNQSRAESKPETVRDEAESEPGLYQEEVPF